MTGCQLSSSITVWISFETQTLPHLPNRNYLTRSRKLKRSIFVCRSCHIRKISLTVHLIPCKSNLNECVHLAVDCNSARKTSPALQLVDSTIACRLTLLVTCKAFCSSFINLTQRVFFSCLCTTDHRTRNKGFLQKLLFLWELSRCQIRTGQRSTNFVNFGEHLKKVPLTLFAYFKGLNIFFVPNLKPRFPIISSSLARPQWKVQRIHAPLLFFACNLSLRSWPETANFHCINNLKKFLADQAHAWSSWECAACSSQHSAAAEVPKQLLCRSVLHKAASLLRQWNEQKGAKSWW